MAKLPSPDAVLDEIADRGTWATHLELLPACARRPTSPIAKLVFVMIGPAGAGKSTLANSIVRTFSPQRKDWTVFSNIAATVGSAHSTQIFTISRLIRNEDYLELVDSVGLKELDQQTALIWCNYLRGGILTENDIKCLVKPNSGDVVQNFVQNQGKIPTPDAGIITIGADIETGSTVYKSVLKFIEALNLAGIGHVVVITKVAQLKAHYSDPNSKRQLDTLRAGLRQAAGPGNVFEVESYTNNTECPSEIPETRKAIANMMYRAVHNALTHKHPCSCGCRIEKLLKPEKKADKTWVWIIVVIFVAILGAFITLK